MDKFVSIHGSDSAMPTKGQSPATGTPYGRYARILMDYWFKRTFAGESRKRLMTLFLEALIPERKIKDLTYVPNEHPNPFHEKRDSRIDIECTDADGSRFIVEMQVEGQKSFYDRAVLYSSYAIQQQLPKDSKQGGNYFFPTVYFIGLMDFSFHENTDEVRFRYLLKRDCSDEVMTDHLQYIFLELPNCSKALTSEATVLDNVCYALRNMERMTARPAQLKEEIFKLLFDTAEICNFTAEEKVRYEHDMTTERDRQNQLEYVHDKGFDEGLKKGREEGLVEGHAEGEAKGFSKGQAEGEAKGKTLAARSIAKSLLEKGVDIATIVACTGLSQEEISSL